MAPAIRKTGNRRRATIARERRDLRRREFHRRIRLDNIYHPSPSSSSWRHFRPARAPLKIANFVIILQTPVSSSLGLPVRCRRQWASAAPSVHTPGVIFTRHLTPAQNDGLTRILLIISCPLTFHVRILRLPDVRGHAL